MKISEDGKVVKGFGSDGTLHNIRLLGVSVKNLTERILNDGLRAEIEQFRRNSTGISYDCGAYEEVYQTANNLSDSLGGIIKNWFV